MNSLKTTMLMALLMALMVALAEFLQDIQA